MLAILFIPRHDSICSFGPSLSSAQNARNWSLTMVQLSQYQCQKEEFGIKQINKIPSYITCIRVENIRLGRGRAQKASQVHSPLVKFSLKDNEEEIVEDHAHVIYSFKDYLLHSKHRYVNHMFNKYYLMMNKWESGNLQN